MPFKDLHLPYENYISAEYDGVANGGSKILTLYDWDLGAIKLAIGDRLFITSGYVWTDTAGVITINWDFNAGDSLAAGEIILSGAADANAGLSFPANGLAISPEMVATNVGNIRITHSVADTRTVAKLHGVRVPSNVFTQVA